MYYQDYNDLLLKHNAAYRENNHWIFYKREDINNFIKALEPYFIMEKLIGD